MTWNLVEAETRLADVVDRAVTEGPQTITHGGHEVVVLSAERYAQLMDRPMGFKEFLMSAPGLHELDLSRDRTPLRDIEP